MSEKIDPIHDLAAALEEMAGTRIQDNAAIVPHGERPCPICGEKMAIEQISGVTIDTCEDHGVWLDTGELPTMLNQARSGVRTKYRDAIRRARREGKTSGMLLGSWSLLLD